MSWQTAIFLHLIFATAYSLVHRSVSRQFFSHAKVAIAFIYLFFVTPLAVIYSFLNYDISFNFSLLTWIFLIIAGILFALHNITGYQSNAHIDASQFSIISNLLSPFTIIIAAVFLSERMSAIQLIGVAILVSAAALVSIKRTTKKTFEVSSWSMLAILSTLLGAMAITFEKHLLGEMNVGTYMIIGWGLQTLSMVIIAGKEWHTLKDFGGMGIFKLSSLGVLRFLLGVTFVIAISQVDVGLIASIISYKTVLIFIGGILFLNERSHLVIRFLGSVLATTGLLLLF